MFTSSLDATHRLTRLLQLYYAHSPVVVAEYSSQLPQRRRSQLLSGMRSGAITVLVCSDAMARGMDIANVDCVVNYDVPAYVKTYIHRVGRTARAGKPGTCVTLVKKGQVRGG